jgi:UV radiation resistance-associated gene protein
MPLSQNRRLRHLQGITIRNLSFEQNARRPRGKTFDDEALPFTLASPHKQLAQREALGLMHSRSSTSLASEVVDNKGPRADNTGEEQEAGLKPDGASSSLLKKLRRRSTLDYGDASMEHRRNRMSEVIRSRMADSFFSLHVDGVEG